MTLSESLQFTNFNKIRFTHSADPFRDLQAGINKLASRMTDLSSSFGAISPRKIRLLGSLTRPGLPISSERTTIYLGGDEEFPVDTYSACALQGASFANRLIRQHPSQIFVWYEILRHKERAIRKLANNAGLHEVKKPKTNKGATQSFYYRYYGIDAERLKHFAYVDGFRGRIYDLRDSVVKARESKI